MDRILELKVRTDTPSGAISPGTSGLLQSVCLPNITQGDTDALREGNIIHVKRLHIRLLATDTAPYSVRVIYLIDRQANGTTPAVSDVLASTTYLAQYNPNNVIGLGGLALKFCGTRQSWGNPTVSAATYVSPLYDRKVKLDMPVQYIGTAGAAADIGKERHLGAFNCQHRHGDLAKPTSGDLH